MLTDPSRLIDELNKLPHQIRTAADAVVEKKKELEHAKLTFDVFYSDSLLSAPGNNATEKKAFATKDSHHYKEIIINTEAELDRAENELKYLENRFIALRRISGIEESLIKSQI